MPTITEPSHAHARMSARARLGTNCEITRHFAEFTHFCRENPVSGRFALQSEARDILRGNHRVRNCLRAPIVKNQPIHLWRAQGVETLHIAHYDNLQTCASVWVCPVCAAKIAKRRLTDLQTGIATWESSGNTVLMATFTLQHVAGDTCAEVLQAITEAHQRFWKNRAGRSIAKDFGIVGKVRGLEVTFTLNGWHWHYHVLLFVRGLLPPNERSVMGGEMSAAWSTAVSQSGRFADSVHGLVLNQTSGYVGEYFTKHGKLPKGGDWDESHEIALSTVKKAAKGGSTPWELLTLSLCGDKSSTSRFREYAQAVRGKSQIHWSKGLRGLLGLSEAKSDEELSQEHDRTAVLLAKLERHHWQVIIGNDARAELLKVAASGHIPSIVEFLIDLGLYDVEFQGD